MINNFENKINKEVDNRDISSIISRIEKAEEKNKDSKETEKDYKAIERLKKNITEIYEIIESYIDTYDLVKPSGRIENGRRLSLKEEHEIFKKEIKNNPDYNPIYTYPEIEKIRKEDINDTIKELEKKREEINIDSNEHVRSITLEYLENMIARANFILAVKEEDDEMAYKYSADAYDDIYNELIVASEDYYQKKLKDNPAYDNPLRNELKKIKITSEDLKDIFEIVKDIFGVKGFKVELRKDEEGISVSDTDEKIKIPENEKYSADRAMSLASHEIGTHIVSIENSKAAGFPGIYAGKNATTFQEGIAVYSEERSEKHIFGDNWPDDKDWYIHAMAYRRKGNGFGKVYLEMKERIKKQLLAQKIDENVIESESEKKALMVCRRIFRGMHDLSSDSTYYYTKDASYFEGYIKSKKMVEKEMDHYLTDLRVDPYLLPYFLSLKAIPEKALCANRKVIEALWDKKGFTRDFLENYDWYKENTQMDRHMAYRREFGQIEEEVEETKVIMEGDKKNN